MFSRVITSHRFLLVAAMLVVVAASYSHSLQSLERWALHTVLPLVPNSKAEQNVVVVTIDDEAIERFGPWPWPRDRIAAVVDQLQKLGAGVIGLAFPLSAPQTPARLAEYQEQAVGLPKSVRNKVRAWLQRLDTDRILSQSLQRAGNVILAARTEPIPRSRPSRAGGIGFPLRKEKAPSYLPFLEPLLAAPPIPLGDLTPPLETLAKASRGVGFIIDPDRAHAGGITLGWRTGEQLIPSFALRMAMGALAYRPDDLGLTPHGQLRMGTRAIPTAPDLIMQPTVAAFYQAASPIPTITISALWTDKDAASRVRNRAVLIGPAASLPTTPRVNIGDRTLPAVMWEANAINALVNDSAVKIPGWHFAAQRLLLLAVCLYLLLLPLRWQGKIGLVAGSAGAAALLNGGLLLLVVQGVWLPVVVPALFLLVGQLALYLRHHHHSRLKAEEKNTGQALRSLAENLMNQGRLDLAYDRLCQCPPDRANLELLYHLALEFERRRQFGKALSAYDRIVEIDPGYRDADARRQRFRTVTQHAGLTGTTGGNAATVVMVDDPTIERPIIGRYHIECELGRGAMGVVYRGVDPKIGRKVAIKCLAFTEEFEGRELEEIQRRFYREAEAAGRLDHPNVVTVYDVGEEHDLAYIAMDYVEGTSLEAYTHPEHLLPVAEVIEVVAQVAEALDYAHERNVVHRDIKPGNIIYNRDSGVVKVTDFGIARLTDESKTKSGSVLGSPAYMSPEQVAGKKVDGRSDLFSLGTTLYQLLTGELPFTGDSVTNVLYRILNEKPKSVKRLRDDIPTGLSRLVARTLNKDPKKRYQTGAALAEALRRCL
ncbi:MAG: hypothetical protein Kow006_11610 [Gammaproteobacteria bacterium]